MAITAPMEVIYLTPMEITTTIKKYLTTLIINLAILAAPSAVTTLAIINNNQTHRTKAIKLAVLKTTPRGSTTNNLLHRDTFLTVLVQSISETK